MNLSDDEITCISVQPAKTDSKTFKTPTTLNIEETRQIDKLLEESLEKIEFKQKTMEANETGIQELLDRANKEAIMLSELQEAISKQDEEIGAKIDRLEKLEKQLEKARVKKVVVPQGRVLKSKRYDRQVENLYKQYVLSDSSSGSDGEGMIDAGKNENGEMREKCEKNEKFDEISTSEKKQPKNESFENLQNHKSSKTQNPSKKRFYSPNASFSTNSEHRRKLPENPPLLAKIPDEIIQYIQTHAPLDSIPIVYRRYDDNREPWLHGSITSCRMRYGQETMLVTDESTQTIINVPYDSIAIDTSKKQPKLVQSLSHCQRIRNNDLEAEDQADNAIVPMFRTHRVYLKNICKSAWIISKIDEDYFYVMCDDVYIGGKDKEVINSAKNKSKFDAETRVKFALDRPCQSLELQIEEIEKRVNEEKETETTENEEVGTKKLKISEKTDDKIDENAKIFKTQKTPKNPENHASDNDFTPQEMFNFQSINGVHKVKFDEIAPIMGQLFFYDDFEDVATKMFMKHFPHLLNAPCALSRVRQFDSQFNDSRKQSRWKHWFDTIYSLLVNTEEETKEQITQYYDKLNLVVNDELELRCGSLVKVVEVDQVFHFFKIKHKNEDFTEWLHPTSLVLKTDETGLKNGVDWGKVKFEKLLHSENSETSGNSSKTDSSAMCLPRTISEPDIDWLLLIQPEVTKRNKVLITMENLPQILTNPLDTKMQPEFHTYPPIIIPIVFSKYYGNWERFCEKNPIGDGIDRVYYTYNSQRVDNKKQLLKCIDHCNKQVYDLFYNKHNHSSSAYFEIPLLTVENFCFDIDVDHTNKREPNLNVFTRVSADVTRNQEAMPIPGYVKTLWEKAYHAPPTLNYISTQKPTNEVFSQFKLGLSKDYQVCCSCEDGCTDATKCECLQRFHEIYKSRLPDAKSSSKSKSVDPTNLMLGYQDRRLSPDMINSSSIGIVECNPNCQCMKQTKPSLPNITCGNRVVQCGIRQSLYLELMPIKGWGVKTRYDIPAGSFISTYAAILYTDGEADEAGKEHGDNFLCDLDYIEICEDHIKGNLYSNMENDSAFDDSGDSDDNSNTNSASNSTSKSITPNSMELPNSSPDNNETALPGSIPLPETALPEKVLPEIDLAKLIHQNNPALKIDMNFDIKISESSRSLRKNPKKSKNWSHTKKSNTENSTTSSSSPDCTKYYKSVTNTCIVRSKTRRHFLPKEKHENKKFMNRFGRKFVVDAMFDGNIGRWFNHSCEPNMGIVNCFTYTQDMRFPVLAFFTTKTVKAGEELTWCYGDSYDMETEKVAAVDMTECVCGAQACKKQLVKFKRHKFPDTPTFTPSI